MREVVGLRAWLPKSEFFRNVVTLATGTAAAQALSIVTAPINSRLYDPADYGALGAYMSITGVFTTAATLLYHHPVVLTEEEDDARDLVFVCLATSVAVALIGLIAAVLLGSVIARHFGAPALSYWFLCVPISAFAGGANAAFSAFANRKKAYAGLASARFATALTPLPITIGLGLLLEGPTGLLLALVFSHVAGALSSGVVSRRAGLRLSLVQWPRAIALAKRHRQYPLYTLPSDLIMTVTTWLPVQLLVAFSGPAAVGAFSMATRMLGIPSTLVGGAVGEVFRQQAAKDCAESAHCRPAFLRTAKHASLLAIPAFLVVILVGEELFAFVLGEPWRAGGTAAQILAPLYCLQFVVSPLTVMYYLRGRQKEDLMLHVLLLALMAGAMTAGRYLFGSVWALLGAYACAYGSIYLVYFVRSYQLAGPTAGRVAILAD